MTVLNIIKLVGRDKDVRIIFLWWGEFLIRWITENVLATFGFFVYLVLSLNSFNSKLNTLIFFKPSSLGRKNSQLCSGLWLMTKLRQRVAHLCQVPTWCLMFFFTALLNAQKLIFHLINLPELQFLHFCICLNLFTQVTNFSSTTIQ